MLFAHGHKFGGHALYIRDGRLKNVYNLGVEFVRLGEEVIGDSPVPNASVGTTTLYVNDSKVAERTDMRSQVGKLALSGEGLNVGRDDSAAGTDTGNCVTALV